MIRLRKKEGTPLIDGMYVIFQGLYQIRLKGTQECMSAVSTVDDLVRCGRLLIKRYGTVEHLRKLLSEGEYNFKMSEQELVRRQYEETNAVKKDLYKEWYNALAVGQVETERRRGSRKRIELRRPY